MCPNLSLLQNVLRDVYSGNGDLSSQAELDFAYASSRTACEGISFLTVTLPLLGKAVIKGLEDGVFTRPPAFKGWKRGALPAFLHGLLCNVFDPRGTLLSSPDPYSVQECIGVCMLFYKLEVPYKESLTRGVIENFVKVEEELSSFSLPEDDFSQRVMLHAKELISKVLSDFDPKDIQPSHGPGSVATGELLNRKYAFKRKYQRLHQKYPYYEYFSPSLGKLSFENPWYSNLELELNPVAKVVLVPKDSRGPRLISMEPLEIQWIQQGLLKKLVAHIERHPLTRGKVNFTEQSFNRQLAYQSSIDGRYATVDLKDASDRVPLILFRHLFPENVVEHFEACRSTCTKLPDGRLIALRKFAPMGSALCFPVMALTLWALLRSIITLSPGHATNLAGSVHVYGDDIIIPIDTTELVFRELPRFFLRINEGKSFHKGLFRESCGMDAFKGVVTTPMRCKVDLRGRHSRDTRAYSHFLSLSEAFFDRGYWRSASFLRAFLRRTYGALHWTSVDQSGLRSPCSDLCLDRNRSSHATRWNDALQREEQRVRTVISPKQFSKMSCHERFLRGLVNPTGTWNNPCRVTGRRTSVIKFCWRPV